MASPPPPSQITDTSNNSYFCKNCGTRLIHTTPVSNPLCNVEVPLCTYHTALLPAHACLTKDMVAMHNVLYGTLLYYDIPRSNDTIHCRTRESCP